MKTKKIFRPLSGWNLLLTGVIVSAFSIIILSNLNFPVTNAAGNITGRVFQDYNSNGNYETTSGFNSIDRGVANVTVTAYDSTGVQRGSTTTAANGTYTLTATGSGPYRLEFTNLPTGYEPSARSKASVLAGTATNSGSTVQFVADGTTANVNVGLVRSEDYCQNNPSLVVSRFAEGAQNGIYGNNAVLMDFPYTAGTTYTDTTVANYDVPSTHSVGIIASRVGTVFSLAYSRVNRRIYAAAYFKRHAGFGPGADNTINTSDDPGAVYVVDPSTNNVTATFTVPNATTNSHDTTNYGDDNGDTGWNAVGKTSLGGMALADDESRLFVANLQNRRIYALNPTTGASLGNTVQMSTLTMPTPGGTNVNCAANDIRPFAVKYYRGQVYVGAVCSAESTNNTNDLFAYIFILNPTTLVFNATPYYSVALDYSRGLADPGQAAEWRPWEATIQSNFAFPQPMLTDIEFDAGENLILGLRDRSGDQAFDNGPDAKRTAGDTIRGCGAMGAWIMESNGRCGSPATGTAPQGTGQGLGNGEFYHQDDFCLTPNGGNFHDELSWGELIYIPGRQHIITTLLDPISRTIDSSATFDGGFRWFNNTTGNTDRAYRIYNGTGGANVPDFGKANGLGGVTAMCSAAPIEIGNRVWRDGNNNGVQDPQESRAATTPVLMSGVTVRLYNSSNTLLATAVTDQDGEYYFSSATGTNTANAIYGLNLQPNTQYQVRFDNPANYASGGPLFGLFLTTVNQTSQNGSDDSSDSDASNVTNPTNSPAGTFPVISLTTGAAGSNNHTFDVGFAPPGPSAADVVVGGRVTTASGMGIANTTVTLSDNTGERRTALTNAFGYYQFTDVQAGQVVFVTVLSKRYRFSVPTRAITADEDIYDLDFVADN